MDGYRLCLAALVVVACSSAKEPSESPPVMVGAEGRTVEANGGAAAVSIPAGALSEQTPIAVNAVGLNGLAALPEGLIGVYAAYCRYQRACAPRRTVPLGGGTIASSTECMLNLIERDINLFNAAAECVPRPVIGQACDPDQSEPCADGVCVEGVCEHPVRLLGERCGDEYSCGAGYTCQDVRYCAGDLSCDPATQRCVYRTTAPGDPCGGDDQYCVPFYEQECVGWTGAPDTPPMCQARTPDGQSGNYCWLGSRLIDGICTPRPQTMCPGG